MAVAMRALALTALLAACNPTQGILSLLCSLQAYVAACVRVWGWRGWPLAFAFMVHHFVLFAWGLPSDFRPAVMTMGFKRLSASTTVDWMLNSTHLIAMVTTNSIEWYAPT
jgi:hypothetical protein